MDDGSMTLLLILVCDKQGALSDAFKEKTHERIGIQRCSASQLHCVDMNPSLCDVGPLE